MLKCCLLKRSRRNSGTGDNPWTGHTKSIFAKASVLGSLHGAGQWKWEGVESANNGYNEGLTFVSDSPVYFALQNCNKYPIYVHGIKVTTPKQESEESAGVNDIVAPVKSDHHIYNLAGMRMKVAGKGLYIQDGKIFAGK